MKAEEIIDLVIQRHENEDSSIIPICKGLHLEPMLNYTGKMARNAYWQYKKNWHKDRKYVGILDHKIMDPTGKMEHSQLLARSLGKVRIESIRAVYDGEDPFEITVNQEELELLCDIQCSLIEQEVNWGVHDFQQRTHFGYPEMNIDYMRNAVPRDFFLLFFERCNALMKQGMIIYFLPNFFQMEHQLGKKVQSYQRVQNLCVVETEWPFRKLNWLLWVDLSELVSSMMKSKRRSPKYDRSIIVCMQVSKIR